MGVQKTEVSKDQVTLILSLEASKEVNGAYMFEKANAFHAQIRLGYFKGHVHIILVTRGMQEHWLYLYDQFLDDLIYNEHRGDNKWQ